MNAVDLALYRAEVAERRAAYPASLMGYCTIKRPNPNATTLTTHGAGRPCTVRLPMGNTLPADPFSTGYAGSVSVYERETRLIDFSYSEDVQQNDTVYAGTQVPLPVTGTLPRSVTVTPDPMLQSITVGDTLIVEDRDGTHSETVTVTAATATTFTATLTTVKAANWLVFTDRYTVLNDAPDLTDADGHTVVAQRVEA